MEYNDDGGHQNAKFIIMSCQQFKKEGNDWAERCQIVLNN